MYHNSLLIENTLSLLNCTALIENTVFNIQAHYFTVLKILQALDKKKKEIRIEPLFFPLPSTKLAVYAAKLKISFTL